ncbi:unnamed protein product, partial [Symbiodinium necroappetens]
DVAPPRKKRFSWQRPSSPISEDFPPACPAKPYIGAPGTVHQAYSLALQQQVLKSGQADIHLAKMVSSYAPSTLAAYLSKWRHWLRKAQLDSLRSALHSDLVSAYGRSGSIVERRESVSLQATAMLHPNFTPDFILARHCTPSAAFLYVLFTNTCIDPPRHHRSSLAGMSDLYGRDDVAGPLEFQRQVVALPSVPGASDMPPVGSNPELPESVTEALSMTMEPIPQDASSSSGVAEVKVPHLKLSLRAGCSVRGVECGLTGHHALFLGSCHVALAPVFSASVMDSSSSYDSDSASTSFSSEIELFLEAPAADWRPVLRICPRHFHAPRLDHILWFSTCTERAILVREEITIWEAAWGSIAFNHRVLLFSHQQIWLAVALGNCELHRCVATALYLGLLDTLVDKGSNSMALLAFAVPDSDSLEHFIVSIVGRPLGSDPSAPLLTADAAALRRLYHLCKSECAGIGPSNPASIVPAVSGKKSLSKEEIAELMQKFMKAYPSELVRADIMPSSPFLMVVREHLDAGRFSWIPWRLRSSASDEEQFLERRRPRTDAKLLTRLLQEGQPEEECVASVPQSGPVEPIVRRFWDLLIYAIALNDGAHLLHLRKAAKKFLSIALATPSDRNMRPPSLQEIVEADRALWIGVASIQADQGWSLTDALAEMIFARADVYSALAPRLKPLTPPAPPAASGANKRKQPTLPPPPPHKQARPAKAKAKAASKKDTVLASRLLDDASVPSCSDILVLAEALLRESPDLDDRFESGKSVSAGLFFRFKPGARKICISHPLSVRVVNRLIRALAPDHFFSSFVIISGVHSPRHQDSMNACAPNVVLPLTAFTGGELRVSLVSGDLSAPSAEPFVDLPVASGPVSFNARDCPHEVLPSQGLRVVIAAYTLQAALHLHSFPELRDSLAALAFPLPPVDFVYSPDALKPRALPLSPSQRALLPSPAATVGASAPLAPASTNAQPSHDSQAVGALLGSCHLPSPTPRLFLDLFAGARAPVTSAIQSLRRDCFPPVDLIIDASRDTLDDAFFDLLCRIADSGLVGAALAAPVCSKHSILRMRPGGPKPLRDFEHPTGRPDLNWDDSTQLQESALLHDRTRLLLSRVSASGGLIILENPASSLTFHDPLMMSWIESEAPFCAQVASCMVGASFSKAWMFVSNQPCILDLACICTHASGTHASFVGKRDGAGFLSRRTAEYPDELAASLARLCAPFLTDLGPCREFSQWRALLSSDPAWIVHSCRVEDGGGTTSAACWLRPPSEDVLHDLRHRWSHRLFNTGLCLRIAAHLQLAPKEPPLSAAEVAPFLQDIFDTFQVPLTSQKDLLFIAPGQPLRLRLLKFLLSQLHDSEVSLCDQLESGVSLGVGSALEPSQHWPVRDAEPVIPALHICEGAWQSAESHPDIVQALLEEEMQEEWITEYASLEAIQSEFPQVALGRLGLVLAEGRSARLVVDSSISGVTSSSTIPNCISNPRIEDVSACAPSYVPSDPWVGALAGSIHRLSHHIIFLKHLLWVYVDDFLAAFQKATAPLHLSLWVMLLLCLQLPISWSKCSIDEQIIWIGWRISFDTWSVELPEEKIHRILEQLSSLCKQTKVKVKDLESVIGRLLWLTGLWRSLRPLLQPLYAALRDIPCTIIAVSPQLWTQILSACDDSGRLLRSLNHASFPEGARITRAGNTAVSSLAQLRKVPFIKRRLWVAVQDSEHPLRCLSQSSIGALQSWNSILSTTPCVFNIKQAPMLQLVAEADAFADQDQCGLGGYLQWPSGVCRWYSIHLDPSQVAELFPSIDGSLQHHICALELLAQYCLLWIASEMLPRARHHLTFPMRSDNSGAELASAKGLTSVKILGEVLRAFLDFQRRNGLRASVEHIPGYRNDLADELSRLKGALAPLPDVDRMHPPLPFLLRPAGRLCRPDSAKWPKPWR